ncbi:hypothetical protein ACFRAR_08120 [Kitasatospora sp. NPDC056651]|uniref:hypothetical protein n=1 Tax=Kitasatospora sp. NPDC056651 TaxID=3345892 RepID=UPI0036762592
MTTPRVIVVTESAAADQRRAAAAARERRSRRLAAAAAQGAAEETADPQAVEALRQFRLGLGGAPEPAAAAGDASGTGEGAGNTRITVTDRLLQQMGAAGRSCQECSHTFRLGEAVALVGSPTEEFLLRHHDADFCTSESDAHPRAGEAARAAAEFHEGLDAAYPPEHGLRLSRLDPGHPLLARFDQSVPGGANQRRFACWVCGATLRTGEVVVHCPCGQSEPCMSAIHRDPAQGLMCYDHWSRTPGRKSCLTFLVERGGQP